MNPVWLDTSWCIHLTLAIVHFLWQGWQTRGSTSYFRRLSPGHGGVPRFDLARPVGVRRASTHSMF